MIAVCLDPPFGWIEVFLALLVLANAVWNTAIGSSGGVTFAALAATLSPMVAIPVQSVVEGISGGYRAWKLRGFVSRRFLRRFAAGGLGGMAIGYYLLNGLMTSASSDRVEATSRIVVACFILLTTWVPVGRAFASRDSAPMIVGLATTSMSLFVGGMGSPVSASIEGRGEGHRIVLATATAAVIYQYAIRLVVFGLIGFSFVAYWPLLVLLSTASLIGTVIGRRLLLTVDPLVAKRVFRVVVTGIAMSMIVRASV